MLTKPIAVVGLVAGVIVAAGTGAYLAVRQSTPPAHQFEATAESTSAGLTSVEPAVPDGSAVEATDAVVDNLDTTVTEETGAPPPVRETPGERPVTAPAPTPPPSPPPAVPELPAASVAEAVADVTPAVAAPVQTARADLPAVEGWTRPGGTEPYPEALAEPLGTTPTGADIETIGRAPELEPVPSFVELEIAADSVIGLQVETAVSTRTAELEDTVEARVTRDVLVADQVAVPAGTRMAGSVVLVEQGGKLRHAARLGVRFHTLVMEDGLRVPIVTETIYREGSSQRSDSVAKIGGAAVGGAILGAIFGGGRGAAIGGSIGAAGGTAAALGSEAEPAGLPPGTMLTVRLSRPVAVTVEQ